MNEPAETLADCTVVPQYPGGLVPGSATNTKISECSNPIVGPLYPRIPHPWIQPTPVISILNDERLVKSLDVETLDMDG